MLSGTRANILQASYDARKRNQMDPPINSPQILEVEGPCPGTCYQRLTVFLLVLSLYLSLILFYFIEISSRFTYFVGAIWLLVLFLLVGLVVHHRKKNSQRANGRNRSSRRRSRQYHSNQYCIDTVVVVPPVATALAPASVSAYRQSSDSSGIMESTIHSLYASMEPPIHLLPSPPMPSTPSRIAASIYINDNFSDEDDDGRDSSVYLSDQQEEFHLALPIHCERSIPMPPSPAPSYDPPPSYADAVYQKNIENGGVGEKSDKVDTKHHNIVIP